MATKRDIKHDMYVEFHGNLRCFSDARPDKNYNFSDSERRFFTWFIVICLAGVAVTYWLF